MSSDGHGATDTGVPVRDWIGSEYKYYIYIYRFSACEPVWPSGKALDW